MYLVYPNFSNVKISHWQNLCLCHICVKNSLARSTIFKLKHCHNLLEKTKFIYLIISFYFLRIFYFTLFPSFGTKIIVVLILGNSLLISLVLSLPHIMFNYVVVNGIAFNIFTSKICLPTVQHAWPMLLYKYSS